MPKLKIIAKYKIKMCHIKLQKKFNIYPLYVSIKIKDYKRKETVIRIEDLDEKFLLNVNEFCIFIRKLKYIHL